MTAVLLVVSTALAVPAWWTSHRLRWWLLPVAAVAVTGLAALLEVADWPGGWAQARPAVVVSGSLAAVTVGGPLTVAVLRAVSGRTDLNIPGRHEAAPGKGDPVGGEGEAGAASDVVSAAEVLRGGAWIGALERLAIFGTLVAGWPEGVAVVLAVKGLGRYPELRHPGAAERFIIGTFTSVLWAAGCAGLVTLSIS